MLATQILFYHSHNSKFDCLLPIRQIICVIPDDDLRWFWYKNVKLRKHVHKFGQPQSSKREHQEVKVTHYDAIVHLRGGCEGLVLLAK